MSTGSLWLIWICCFTGLYKSAICKRPPKIVGGKNACIKDFPFMASLIHKDLNLHSCGGAIISKNYIITAAHCFKMCSKDKSCITLKKKDFYVRVGSTKWKQGGKNYDIEDLFLHPKFNTETAKYDIALIKIKGKFKFTDTIKIIPIAPKSKVPGTGAKVTLVGWGKTAFESKFPHEVLKTTEHHIYYREKCQKYHDNPITSKHICTYCKAKNCGACSGDSGGPVVYKGKLIGIASFMTHDNCMSNKGPQVHTKVISHLKWIQEYLKV